MSRGADIGSLLFLLAGQDLGKTCAKLSRGGGFSADVSPCFSAETRGISSTAKMEKLSCTSADSAKMAAEKQKACGIWVAEKEPNPQQKGCPSGRVPLKSPYKHPAAHV